MRKFLFSILLLFIFSYGLCQSADDDRYKRPDIDIVDFDEPDDGKEDALVPEPSDDVVEQDIASQDEANPTQQDQDTPKETTAPEAPEKNENKAKEPAPEVQQNTDTTQAKNTRETPKPDQDKPSTDTNDEKQNIAAKPAETLTQPLETDTDKSNKPEPEKIEKPADASPRQPTENNKPNPTAQPNPAPQGQPQGQRVPNPSPNPQQGRPTGQNPQNPQNPQKPPQGAPQQGQPGPQGAQPRPQGRPGPAPQAQPVPQQPEPVRQQVVQEEIVKEEKAAIPEPTPVVKNEKIEKAKKPQLEPEDLLSEEEYRRLVEEDNAYDAYIEQYKGFSESFYKNAEYFTHEVLLPFYRQIRANDYLSLGLSSFLVLYFTISIFRVIGSLFRKKPKFRYNKEETISYADINNTFKRFLSEVDTMKKQMEANAKKGAANASQVGQAGEGTAVSATIPQELQDEISYIAQNLSRNDDLLSKISKDKRQLDSFLVEFQKEVVESHKAIWNELYQLRKLFSMGKLNVSTSGVKSRAVDRDDDTKSLSSNPEVNESKKREDSRLTATQKTVSEGRSKSVATTVSRKVAPPPEKRPQQEVVPKRPSLKVNGDTIEQPPAPEVPQQPREEEQQKEAHVIAPPAEKTPFRKLSRDEDIQPGIQMPAEKNVNPFATGIANQGAVSINANTKTGPFGAARKLSNKIPGGRPSSTQDLDQAINTLPKPDADNNLRNSASLVASQQNSNAINPEAPNIEEKPEVRDNEQNLEEAKPVEQGEEGPSGANEETESSEVSAGPSKAFVPPVRTGPMIGMNAGVRKPGPGMPGNKNMPIPGVPGVKRPGPPGAAVFRGPPGNMPMSRPGGPAPIKQPMGGQVQDGTPTNHSVV